VNLSETNSSDAIRLFSSTAHITGITNPQTAAPIILDNIRRFEEDRPLPNQVDPAQRY
jgi:phosphoglycerate dehydrogenase-like enzyme